MKKFTSLCLIAAILLSGLASCSEKPAEDTKDLTQNNVSNDTPPSNQDSTEEETEDIMAYLGEKDFGSADFTIIGKGPNYGEWEMKEINAEGITGELINDAVYERNLSLHEKYNVNIIGYQSSDLYNEFKNAVNASSGDFELALIPLNTSTSYAVEGLLYDFKELPVVNLENEWYDQNANKSLSVADRLYFSFGDMNLQHLDLTWCVMFNKEIAENNQLENLYDTVKNNNWTMSKLFELSEGVTSDADGNGVMNEYDSYGFVTPFDRTTFALMYGCGINFVEKNADDCPEYSPLNEKVYSIFSDILKFFHSNNNALDINGLKGQWRTSETMFMNNQILFYVECMQNLSRFRDMDVDFGVLPMPKYSSEQERYYNMVCDFPAAAIIPSYCNDLEFTGFIIEAMNAKSHDTVRTAYVDKCLRYKYSRDEESSAMLDIILQTMHYDPAYIYGWGGLTNTIGLLVTKNYDMLASQSKSIEKKIIKDIEKTVEKYGENQ